MREPTQQPAWYVSLLLPLPLPQTYLSPPTLLTKPQAILPRLPQGPPQRPAPKTASNASSTITITLKPMKPTTPTLPLSSIDPAKTSVYDLKSSYASSTSIPAAKIKILYKKKPVTDSKLVSEIIGADSGAEVEFGVMVMGGATAGVASPSVESPAESPAAVAPSESEKGLAGTGAAAVGPSGKEVVATDEFWGDLKNFVLQRIKDEQEGERLVGVFKKAWEADR